MAIANRTTISWTDGGNSATGTITDTPDSETVINMDIAANQTDFLIDFTCDVSQMKTLILLSTGGALTVKTNSSGAPAATISLVDGVPLIWHFEGGYPAVANSPFTATDVTKLYVTNTTATNFKLSVGIDATP